MTHELGSPNQGGFNDFGFLDVHDGHPVSK